jgi:Zn finger protein HypA/HybF involved in hydrogenase expression
MGALVAFHFELEKLTCGECGIIFAVPPHWLNARREEKENNGSFYCPNGHSRQFRVTDVDRLKKELEAEKKKVEWANARADRADREAAAARGQATKLRKRIQNGVCPACQRSFQNLRRHMATKHPALESPPA